MEISKESRGLKYERDDEFQKIVLIMLYLIAVLLFATGLVTQALLSDSTGELANTFELGNVTTKIDEPVFEPTDDTYTTFDKTPMVINTGKNDCYVRVRVTISPPSDQVVIIITIRRSENPIPVQNRFLHRFR